jgi:hypothetical protein
MTQAGRALLSSGPAVLRTSAKYQVVLFAGSQTHSISFLGESSTALGPRRPWSRGNIDQVRTGLMAQSQCDPQWEIGIWSTRYSGIGALALSVHDCTARGLFCYQYWTQFWLLLCPCLWQVETAVQRRFLSASVRAPGWYGQLSTIPTRRAGTSPPETEAIN